MPPARPMLLLPLLLLGGCLSGRLYQDTVEPYTTDFHDTPVGSKRCVLNTHKVQEPFSGYGVNAEWYTDTIVRQLLEAGITKVYYADLRTFTILWNIYTRKQIIVYGD